jgi:hypothetical protein
MMSDNKMGGVPDKTRKVLYKMFDEMDYGSSRRDKDWADAISLLTKIGPKLALKRMRR